jgi:hypothetical protein
MTLKDILDEYGSGKFVGLGAGPYKAGDKVFTVAIWSLKSARLWPLEMVDGRLMMNGEDEQIVKLTAKAYVIEPSEVNNV